MVLAVLVEELEEVRRGGALLGALQLQGREQRLVVIVGERRERGAALHDRVASMCAGASRAVRER